MKVLVTGGLGFIGSETVVSLLTHKMDVVIIDNLFNAKLEVLDHIEELTGIRPKFYEFDVCNKEKLAEVFKKEKPEAIIHFAGYKAVAESVYKPLEYYENNLGTTFALLECMEKYGCKNLVFSSSSTVYGLPDRVPLYETDPVKSATSPYGETKVMIERVLKDVAHVHTDYNIALLRYFNPIGADPSGLLGEDPNGIPNNLLPYIAKVATGELPCLKITGHDYKTPDGTGIRDYIHVCDLAEGHVLALKKLEEKPGLVIYNLGTGRGTSVLDIVSAYESATGIKIKYEFAPRRPGDIPENYANCDKAKQELGFVCTHSIEDACRDSYNFQKRVKEESKK
jgi:UDP-glucose 4-epimerase